MFKSNIFVKQTESAGKNLPVDFHGRVRLAHGTYVATGEETAGSVLGLVRLPVGARVLPTSVLHFESGQATALTCKVGDAENDARYLAASAPGSSAVSKELAANALNDYTLKAEQEIILTTAGATLAAGKKIVFDIFYVVD